MSLTDVSPSVWSAQSVLKFLHHRLCAFCHRSFRIEPEIFLEFLQSLGGVMLAQSDVAQKDVHRRHCGLQGCGFERMRFGVLPPSQGPIRFGQLVLSLRRYAV